MAAKIKKAKFRKNGKYFTPIVSQPKVSISVDLMQEILNFLDAGKTWMKTGPTIQKISAQLGLTEKVINDPKGN